MMTMLSSSVYLKTYGLGIITSVVLSSPVNGFYSLYFNTGTVNCVPVKIEIYEDNKKVGLYDSKKLGCSLYEINQQVNLKIKKVNP